MAQFQRRQHQLHRDQRSFGPGLDRTRPQRQHVYGLLCHDHGRADTLSQWTEEGTAETIAMGTAALGGLCVTSHANGTLNTATFTGVQITGATTATDAPVMTAAAVAAPNVVTAKTSSLSAAERSTTAA